ncbi:uncharacterized protein LOC144351976 [Saccoglossus kowalevskii]
MSGSLFRSLREYSKTKTSNGKVSVSSESEKKDKKSWPSVGVVLHSCKNSTAAASSVQKLEDECTALREKRGTAIDNERLAREKLQIELELLQRELSTVLLDLQLKAVREKLQCMDKNKNEENDEKTNIQDVADIKGDEELMQLMPSLYLKKHEPVLYAAWCNISSAEGANTLLRTIDQKISALNGLYAQTDAIKNSYQYFEMDKDVSNKLTGMKVTYL